MKPKKFTSYKDVEKSEEYKNLKKGEKLVYIDARNYHVTIENIK